MCVALQATHIFSKYISVCHLNYLSFNDTLTNDIVGFEQLGSDEFGQICI